MKPKTALRYSSATKKNALSLISRGWLISEIAKKHNTTIATIYAWKKKYPHWVTLKNQVNGVLTKSEGKKAIKTPKKKVNTVTIKLTGKFADDLAKQAKEDIRTLDAQAKYYILNGIRNHHGIPF
tara:strand:+ start:12277 stop:12651 length:375 start_codon:yes stop_codon:yes gene_type:complete